MVNTCPRLEFIKRSVCIEGARQDFARAKVHWGKAHRHPEMYYDVMMKGARLVADECTKDTIFE